MVAVSSQWMRKQMSGLGEFSKDCANPSGGSSHIGAWFNRNCPPVISVGNGCNSIWGNYCSGNWNSGLFRFSDIIKDRKEVSFLDCLQAGLKEQAYANPMGTISSGLNMGASILGAAPKLFAGLGRVFNGLGNLIS